MAYFEVDAAAGAAFFGRPPSGPIVMLNLLRFRPVADYSGSPELMPASPISGAEAFERYIAHTLPLLRESGGEMSFLGEGGRWLIGPPDEHWDLVMLIRQASAESFLAFASDAAYLSGLGHRAAAIADSRLLPLIPGAVP